MNNKKNEQIYQADDRNFPLNQMRQDLVDQWLDGVAKTKGLLEYELSAIEQSNQE